MFRPFAWMRMKFEPMSDRMVEIEKTFMEDSLR
jgi:hypothetical protein